MLVKTKAQLSKFQSEIHRLLMKTMAGLQNKSPLWRDRGRGERDVVEVDGRPSESSQEEERGRGG